MSTGTVKFFNESKGFGFITDDATKKEIFVHISALNGLRLRENDKVSFDVEDGKKGPNATNVQKI
jgi:cold shock protein